MLRYTGLLALAVLLTAATVFVSESGHEVSIDTDSTAFLCRDRGGRGRSSRSQEEQEPTTLGAAGGVRGGEEGLRHHASSPGVHLAA